MNKTLKEFLAEHLGLPADASDESANTLLLEKMRSGEVDELLKSGKMTTALYAEATAVKLASSGSVTKQAELVGQIASAVGKEFRDAIGDLKKAFSGGESNNPAGTVETVEKPEGGDFQKELDRMGKQLREELLQEIKAAKGNDGASLMKMGGDIVEDDPAVIRVKHTLDGIDDTKTALTYKSKHAERLGLKDMPMMYGSVEINRPTARTKMMSSLWLKFQVMPEYLKEHEVAMLKYILHKERFHFPGEGNEEARLLSAEEREKTWEGNLHFYKAPLIDDTATSGGGYAVPEFFDMDYIVTPTLASENIPSFCHIVPVARGSSAENFHIGRPTVSAAVEGTSETAFDATGFITNHDTAFFRQAGYIEIGRNYLEDAHPGVEAEIRRQYQNSIALWMNEQIMGGDGTTEMLGILNTSGVVDVSSAQGTSGPAAITDASDLLFGVTKPFRSMGGRQNAIYVGNERNYKKLRTLATGVTGDARFVFGNSIEDYQIFGHPFLLEDVSLTNHHLVFFQAQGYRIYMRQGARFVRETRGATLTQKNTVLVGVDFRVGGQLDLGGYAAVIDDFIDYNYAG